MTTYAEVAAVAPLITTAVESGSMPPWPSDPECRSFKHERRMSDADKATMLTWIDDGMPVGDLADRAPIEPPNLDLDDVSIVARSLAPYTPDAATPDDYHCLVMDVDFSEQTYLSGYQVVPDAAGLVHHIILYLVPPNGAAALASADEASAEPGYPCFGSSGHGGQPMGVWAPGGRPQRFPAGSAFVIEPGAKIVAQMHYNTTAGVPAPDQTELHLATMTGAPELRVRMPILSGFFQIAEGDPAATVELAVEFDNDQPRQIFSVMPHMHLLGRTIDLRRDRAGEQTCIAKIDDWDFHWQQLYDLKEDEFVEVRAGDTLRYTCTYDNSAENQPIVDGQQQPPGPVEFGEGTLDEMCLHVVAMVEPFEPDAPAGICEAFVSCVEQTCDPADGLCFLGCGEQDDAACGQCILEATGGCGQRFCPAESAAVIDCLGSTCDADLTDIDAIRTCLATQCAEQFDAQWACITPRLLAGECNAAFSPCGLEY